MDRRYEHIVDFSFCKHCEHKNKKETDKPCDYCLDAPTNSESIRPVYFKNDGSLNKKE